MVHMSHCQHTIHTVKTGHTVNTWSTCHIVNTWCTSHCQHMIHTVKTGHTVNTWSTCHIVNTVSVLIWPEMLPGRKTQTTNLSLSVILSWFHQRPPNKQAICHIVFMIWHGFHVMPSHYLHVTLFMTLYLWRYGTMISGTGYYYRRRYYFDVNYWIGFPG